MYTFREQLTKVTELGLSVCDIDIASEADSTFEFKYSDEEFEQLCYLIKQAFLKSEYMTSCALSRAINDLIIYGDDDGNKLTVSEVINVSIYDLIDYASNLL